MMKNYTKNVCESANFYKNGSKSICVINFMHLNRVGGKFFDLSSAIFFLIIVVCIWTSLSSSKRNGKKNLFCSDARSFNLN